MMIWMKCCRMILPILFLTFWIRAGALALGPVPIGFPDVWWGDEFKDADMAPSTGLPSWLDGYFIAQHCGSYGNQKNTDGQKITHMFNGVGGLALFDVNPSRSTFTGKYYPTQAYTRWNYFNRDFQRSKIAWYGGASAFNTTAMGMWKDLDNGNLPYVPNVDFWKVGTALISVTEVAVVPGYEMDVPALKKWKPVTFSELSPEFQTPNKPMIFLNMPAHERVDPDGTVWGSAAAADVSSRDSDGNQIMKQVLFSITPDMTRKIEGVFTFGSVNVRTECDPNTGRFTGDENNLPGYMHSITSTTNYVILPVTSFLLSNCPPAPMEMKDDIAYPEYTFNRSLSATVPLRFLIFSKSEKRFITTEPLRYSGPLFPSHQWNAYEREDGVIVADMICFEDNVYRYLTTDLKTAEAWSNPPQAFALRFYLEPSTGRVRSSNLLPGSMKMSIEFSQFNHRFEGLKYRWGYAVKDFYQSGNSIIKMDMDNPGNNPVAVWEPGPTVSVTEPIYVDKPNPKAEDDGIIMVKGLDSALNKTWLYVLNARNMRLISKQLAPASVPFGFHNRYYSKEQLGVPSKTRVNPVSSPDADMDDTAQEIMEKTEDAFNAVKKWVEELG